MNDGLRTLHRDREAILCSLPINSYDFPYAHELNEATKLAGLHGQSETHWSILRDHERRFQQQAADADVFAHCIEVNYAGTRVRFELNRILQIETAMLALCRR